MTPPSIALEPTPGKFTHPLTCYLAATRPAFLATTLVACALGLAAAAYGGVRLDAVLAAVTVLLALLVHAGANVLNDYYDARNGTDAANTDRLFPFTGGSRFIQNGVLTPTQTARFGYALLVAAMLGGGWLAWQVGGGLLVIGGLGLLIGWAYSATPLRLNSRGLGELCVLTGFLGVVVGADYVQRQAFDGQPLAVGLPYALLVTNLLYINQFPDRRADRLAGKRHWVVRLPAAQAALGYPLLALFGAVWLVLAVGLHRLPSVVLWSALPLVFSAMAAVLLHRHAETPSNLLPAIRLTLMALLLHGGLLTLILFLEAP